MEAMKEPASEFPLYQLDILEKFGMSDGILYEYPKVAEMIKEINGLRRFKAWALRTRCGDKMELDSLVPAKDHTLAP